MSDFAFLNDFFPQKKGQPRSRSTDIDGTVDEFCGVCGGTGIDPERSAAIGDLEVCRWYYKYNPLCNGGEQQEG